MRSWLLVLSAAAIPVLGITPELGVYSVSNSAWLAVPFGLAIVGALGPRA